ncbi:MAG: hypothetical protein AAFV93_08135, partial [Chloroflexota bacterium]
RYCEVLAIYIDVSNIVVDVYNTMGHSACPNDIWLTLDGQAIANDNSLLMARLNGPRYWVLNGIEGRGDTVQGDVVEFNGMNMRWVAKIELPLRAAIAGIEPIAYTPNEVQRDTTYTYLANNMVYELTSPEGDVYRMQSYSQNVDPTLTIAELETLGDRLDLPVGWRYDARILAEDEQLIVNGVAVLVADEFENAYQKLD